MIFHYEFHCTDCGYPIVLHAETTARQFEPQGIRANNFHSLIVPCTECKHVGIYSADKNSPHYDQTFRVVSPGHAVETEFLGLMQCDGEDDKFLAPLFSAMTPAMPDEERQAEIASWIWDDLRCPAGHIIRTILKA